MMMDRDIAIQLIKVLAIIARNEQEKKVFKDYSALEEVEEWIKWREEKNYRASSIDT